MDRIEAAGLLVERARSRPWGLAAAAVDRDGEEVVFDAGDDPIDATATFEWGSITKTMTGVLLAHAVVCGELEPGTTIGEVLGITGPAASITVHELAIQRSGLPRLPPNLDLTAIDEADPYADYSAADLHEALCTAEPDGKAYLYSNYGFMALGEVLASVTGTTYPELLQERVLAPLGMTGTGCPPPTEHRLPGYSGSGRTPWWTSPLPGAGGVGGPIVDLVRYVRAHLDPPDDDLGRAIHLATEIHAPAPDAIGYGWVHQGGGLWHNGGTGGFRSFVAFHPPTSTAVALLANGAQADIIDAVGFKTLTDMVRSTPP